MYSESFSICLSSPPDREKLVAEIFIGNQQWAELNQESDELVVELYPRQDGKPWSFKLEEVLAILNAAKQRLTERS